MKTLVLWKSAADQKSTNKDGRNSSYSAWTPLPHYQGDRYAQFDTTEQAHKALKEKTNSLSPDEAHAARLDFLRVNAPVTQGVTESWVYPQINQTLAKPYGRKSSADKNYVDMLADVVGASMNQAKYRAQTSHAKFFDTLFHHAKAASPEDAVAAAHKAIQGNHPLNPRYLEQNPRAVFHQLMGSHLPQGYKVEVAQHLVPFLGLTMHEIMELINHSD